MKIEQFEDKGLSHYSYVILSECDRQIVLIDPSRDVSQYLAYAENNGARIIGVIETHPHADFVSGHLELHQTTGATIFCSALVGAVYPHQTFDDGNSISFGKITLKALNTSGHSPDSISIVLTHDGKDKAVFTGDTLFIGDCGRPDLRESAGNLTAKREELAAKMYHSLREKLMVLDNEVIVYPAHGAGTLCGKALSEANSSTIGAEKLSNWSLQNMTESEFISMLLQDQPFVPKYFPFDVELNKHGAGNLAQEIANVPIGHPEVLNSSIYIIDTRAEKEFKKGHLPGSINLQNGGKFETWLGSIIAPEEAFYLVAENEQILESLILRCAKIGYEHFIERAFVFQAGTAIMDTTDLRRFSTNQTEYTIVDIRNTGEVKEHPVFKNAIHIPLPELRERVSEIPFNKPIIVHCAGGYRSAAGSSIINNAFGNKAKVYDLGEAIKDFFIAMDKKEHWEKVYQTKSLTEVSWYEPVPETSLKIIASLKLCKNAAIIDIGGGDSLLADHLLALGYTNITVLDISAAAIERAKLRLGPRAALVKWIIRDMLLFTGSEKFDLWHDRATFHFLTDLQDRHIYLDIVNRNLKEKGYLIVSTFALDGPEKCSNLPVHQFSESTLFDVFGLYFTKINCFEKEHPTPVLTLQQFLYCTFQKTITFGY